MCYIGVPTRMVFKSAHLAAPGSQRRGGMRSFRRLHAGLVAVALAVSSASLLAQTQGLRVVPLVRDDRVLVTFELREGLTPDVLAAIDSGLKTTFTYTVELRLDVPGWIDRTIGTAVVANSVEYDNLTRKHTIERRIDGRMDPQKPVVTDDAAEVSRWLTSMTRLSLFSTRLLAPNREYYVRVSATARPSYGSILWPFGSGTSAQGKFTFIPR